MLAVLVPFVLLGTWQAHAKDDVRKSKIIGRELSRSRSYLIRNARIFIGDGHVIENGAVLVRNGKIAEVYDGNIPDEKTVNADPIEAAGKTILPGLIDSHVHLGAPGGFLEDWSKYDAAKSMTRALAAYLYSGVTAVKSVGDPLDAVLAIRAPGQQRREAGSRVLSGGAACSRRPAAMALKLCAACRTVFATLSTLSSCGCRRLRAEAKEQVDALKSAGVDGIKAIMESGAGGRSTIASIRNC